MKKVLLESLFTLLCIQVFGEEVDIKLYKNKQETGTRSISIAPTATYDGNTANIYYNHYLLANVQVRVKNLSGNTVYSNVISIFCTQPSFSH